jgi:hypothetical protein
MKKILIFIAVLVATAFSAKAQQEDYAKFTINEAIIDGVDLSTRYRKEGAYLVFYNSKGNEFCMANVWPKTDSQSYGVITDWKEYNYKETADKYAMDVFTFNWHYRNSYDNKKGVASCRLIKIYKPSGVVYEYEYVLSNGSTARFSGYMQGSMKF